jgi:Family of unknown function (DUF6152)
VISSRLPNLLIALSMGLLAVSASAHHSFATFDMTKRVTVTGTVKEFQWQNPHIWIFLVVEDHGQTNVWDVEGGSVVGLKREGWSKDAFKPGDKVTITIHPKRDGTRGGSFVQGTTVSGKFLGRPDEKQVTATPVTP